MKVYFSLVFSLLFLFNCSKGDRGSASYEEVRWYSKANLEQGKILFKNNCAVCHGNAAQGANNWQQPFADGTYPPPPLDGTAHTWHHPMSVLKSQISEGSLEYGGKMPSFKEKLSEAEILSIIAYFQNKWPPEVYEAWARRGGFN